MERRDRMIRDFTDIIAVDSPSFKEGNTAELLRAKLTADGFTVAEDGAGKAAGGECGNLIASLRGNADLPAVALLAHMDTVGPCENKRWVIEGDIIRSAGDTILGGDDAAGIVIALETARRVREAGIPRGDILIILTIAEEVGLLGAKYLDHTLVKAATRRGELPEFCYVLDSSGPAGAVIAKAPSHTDVYITVTGKAAHAGIEPEKGVNAAAALAEAVAAMELGRIDAETTANIGVIGGGLAKNVVCETATAEGEARSIDPAKLRRQLDAMRTCVDAACKRRGATYEFREDQSYTGFSLGPDEPVMRALAKAARGLGYELNPIATGGGSDANVLNAIGIPAANLPVGMHDVHGAREYADLAEAEAAIELLVGAFAVISGQ